MKFFLSAFAAGGCAVTLLLATQTVQDMPRLVSTGENRLRMLITGHGSPAVIFECFGPANLEVWNQVQPEVARFTQTVAYDHGGHWGSEPGPKPRDARQIAHELRGALRTAGIAPPFVLVGYSFGGPYIRVFAGLHPEEVAGLVLVDPAQEKFMQWFEKAFPDFAPVSSRQIEAGNELASRWSSMNLAQGFSFPDMPITLITGVKTAGPLGRYAMPRWLGAHQDWLRDYPNARHIITANSGHDVVLKEPELVVEAIREMVSEVSAVR